MAIEKDSFITAADFTGLKALVKAECGRRNQLGSVAVYAGSAWDYTTVPSADNIALLEHYSKLYTPINAINGSGLTAKSDGDKIDASSLVAIANRIASLSTYQFATGAATGCAASCTGLCTTGCWNACTSCTGSCIGTCSGSCSGGCQGCGGDCSRSCTHSCSGRCDSYCNWGCSSACQDYT